MQNIMHIPEPEHPHIYDVELTDTFGGEANYTWVERKIIEFTAPYSEMQLRRAIRSAVGLTGIKCDVDDGAAAYWDTLTIRPRGYCLIAFARARV